MMNESEQDGVEFDQSDENFVIDYSNTSEDSGFEPIPRGVYPAVIDSVEFGKSKSSGNPMWTIVAQITDGEYANRKLFTWIPFSEKMAGRNKKTFNRLGLPQLANAPFNPADDNVTGLLIGKECRLRVDIDPKPYEGQKRNRVKDILPATEGDAFLGA